MNILVPLNSAEAIERYIKAGADELYMGFYDEVWRKRFGEFSDINRMSGFGKYANKYSFREILELISIVKSYGKSAFVTLNANVYEAEQIEYIEENYLPMLKKVGIDGIIVSDLALGKQIIKYGIKPVASTMCAIYNSDIAEIYKNSGFERIILPRDLSLEEIEMISEKEPELDIEVFFMRNGCIFSDGFCLGMHRPETGSTCALIHNQDKQIYSKLIGFEARHNLEMNDEIYNQIFHHNTCGMCSLYKLKKMGVNALKIVGRADNINNICRDIEITKKNIDIVNGAENEREYLENMIFPHKNLSDCKMGLSCYYPETRFSFS